MYKLAYDENGNPYWKKVIIESGVGPEVSEIEETTKTEIDGRVARREISVFDAMMAEIVAEKEIRAEKFRKTHDLCKKSKDDTPADRKRNKLYRLRKLYGDVWEDGREWYYENGKTGSKKTTGKDAEIFRNLKERSVENDARRDYITNPVERKVGYNTVQRMMFNADKRMREIRAEYAECGFDTYDGYCEKSEYNFRGYPDEYYQYQSEWNMCYCMIVKYGMERANKYVKGEC